MKVTKGCGNELCMAHKKKETYKEIESFCSKCGNSLVYVCKDCYTQLQGKDEKYCVRCAAKHDDRKDKAKKVVVGVVLTVGGVALNFGKRVISVAKKM